jgi:alkanesulfonate monooxygenase SsuD/methylene tetrahydromethanopterin reductase-like flavin-dependent oxidoreductase (luciferase family)
MKYGISLPNMGPAQELVALGVAAEAAGYDGVFLWDHLHFLRDAHLDVHDPWVLLGALAVRTRRVLLGTMVTPVARRQPWELAKQVVTLSHLTGGRVVLGVGLGEPASDEFEAFGLEGDDRVRAARLDEGLAVLDGIWTGEPFEYAGQHFTLDVDLKPAPVAPVPIWVAGKWPGTKPFRRAAARQGVIPIDPSGGPMAPEAYAAVSSVCGAPRAGFDVVATVMDDIPPSAYEEAGATWALWSTWPFDDWQQRIGQIISAGPPT